MTNKGLLCLLAVGLLSACDVNPAERIQAGNEMFNRGDYPAALNAYQVAQVAAPDQPEPYFNAASPLAQTGRLEKAIAALNQALLTADTELAAKAYYNLGNIYFEMSRYSEAVQAYQQTLLRDPDDQDARYNFELALRRIAPPTPRSDPEATPTVGQTPTNRSPGEQALTPTPTDKEGSDLTPPSSFGTPENSFTPPPPLSSQTRAEAEQRLDAIQSDQQTLQQGLQSQATIAASLEKDW